MNKEQDKEIVTLQLVRFRVDKVGKRRVEVTGKMSIPLSWLGKHKPENCQIVYTNIRCKIVCFDVTESDPEKLLHRGVVTCEGRLIETVLPATIDSVDHGLGICTVLFPELRCYGNNIPLPRTSSFSLKKMDKNPIVGSKVFELDLYPSTD